MSVFNRRNALVGYLALRGIPRYRRRRERVGRALKITLFAALALVSLGILAGIAGAFLRRRSPEEKRLEGYAVADAAGIEEGAEAEGAAAAQVEAPSEPIAAT